MTNKLPIKSLYSVYNFNNNITRVDHYVIKDHYIFNFLDWNDDELNTKITFDYVVRQIREQDLTRMIVIDFVKFRKAVLIADVVFDSSNQFTDIEELNFIDNNGLSLKSRNSKIKPIFLNMEF